MMNNLKSCLKTGNEAAFLISHSLKCERHSYSIIPNSWKKLYIFHENYNNKMTIYPRISRFLAIK